ncbi:MAG: 1-acyl-sn-glycerol-3-phosphate acyltransferase [Bacteroidia bacterium]|nr:1-acyl-sn-glycerol-3-phosphate acyltransferase [Bacteroidia bacterium]
MPELDLRFQEIRPYFDEEINEVLQRLTTKPSFYMLMAYLFPEMSGEEVAESFKKIFSSREFQKQYIYRAIKGVQDESTDGFSIEGFEFLDPHRPTLYLSNHRDIILDSAFLNTFLFEHGFETTQIAIGNNLMVSPLVTDLMKLNKSFVVHRDVPRNQLYHYSERLSAYIRTVIRGGESIWLAQKSGRTKDGDDRTHTGLMKMLNITGTADIKASFCELNILPMAVSYEYEPCDYLKVEELVHTQQGMAYEKDDKLSMIKGIREYKGRVHIAFSPIINENLDELDSIANRNDWIKALCDLIDNRIHRTFHLWPNNYVAADLMENGFRFQSGYTPAEKEKFLLYLENRLKNLKGPQELLRNQMIKMYAMPVFNREHALSKTPQ